MYVVYARRRRGRQPYGPARNSLGDPEPPRRRLEYPGGGAGGGELPRSDSGPAGEPEGRGRRAPGGAWGQLSERARDELTRPLRVESGHTSSPGEDPSRWQPDHRDLRQGGPRLPEPEEEPVEGGGEPKTIERPRVRARFADQGEVARPPEESWREDREPPHSPGGALARPSTPSDSVEPGETGGDGGRQQRKQHQQHHHNTQHTTSARLFSCHINLEHLECSH